VTGLRRELSGLLAIAQRDVIKLLRDRPRLAVNLAFPVLLIGGLGAILQPTVGRVTGVSAVTLAFTGVLAASLFQSAAAGMISIVEDRENDFSRELFVAPVSRLTLVGGKIAGETLVALCQGAGIVVFAVVFGVAISPSQLALLLGPGLACCLLGGAFGLATIAVLPNQRSAMQIFQFLIIPQYVLGGVLVPLRAVRPAVSAGAGARHADDLCGQPDPRRVLRRDARLPPGRFRQPAAGRGGDGHPVRRPADRGRDGVRLPGANPLISYRERTR
jgi:ABC-2 type transport system permease protein